MELNDRNSIPSVDEDGGGARGHAGEHQRRAADGRTNLSHQVSDDTMHDAMHDAMHESRRDAGFFLQGQNVRSWEDRVGVDPVDRRGDWHRGNRRRGIWHRGNWRRGILPHRRPPLRGAEGILPLRSGRVAVQRRQNSIRKRKRVSPDFVN